MGWLALSHATQLLRNRLEKSTVLTQRRGDAEQRRGMLAEIDPPSVFLLPTAATLRLCVGFAPFQTVFMPLRGAIEHENALASLLFCAFAFKNYFQVSFY